MSPSRGSIRLALFGHPVAHSPSPGVHQAFGRQFGLDIDYRLIDAPPEDFIARLGAFRAAGGTGCNITLPLKGMAFCHAAEARPRAALARAANTLWWSGDSRCCADNTDGEGLVRDLEQNLDITLTGLRVCLLGAGGAAAGVLGALLERRPGEVIIANRTRARAEDLAARHAGLGPVIAMGLADLAEAGAFDLVIDATATGHAGEPPPIAPAVLAGAAACYSLNYGTAALALRRLCGDLGVVFHDGLGMLVEQAACSFRIWTGRMPETAPVLAELRS